MVDKKQKKNKKQRRNARSKAVGEISKRGQLPSSVQALLGYLGGGGPTPMYQQPVNLQKERAGVDSIETLSQIIRQQNMMNVSYMQNMERLAFKNEIQEQLKKQGQENKEELKQQSQVQKKEQEEVKQVLQETAERTIQQQRVSLMQKLAYERRNKNRSEKVQSLQEQLEILDGSIRNSKVSDLRSSLLQVDPKLAQRTSIPSTPYQAPLGTNDISVSSWLNRSSTPAPSSAPISYDYGLAPKTPFPLYAQTPMVSVNSAAIDDIVQKLPALDRNKDLNLQLQFLEGTMSPNLERLYKAAQLQQKTIDSTRELARNLQRFKNLDSQSSSGNA